MPIIDIVGLGKVEFPDEMSPEDISAAIENEILPNADIDLPGSAIGRGFERGLGNLTSAYGSAMEGVGESLGLAGLESYGRETSEEAQADIAQIPRAPGNLGWAGELFGEQAPIMGPAIAGGMAGAGIGSAFGPIGTVAGGLLGGAAASVPMFFGWNRERQMEQLIEKGDSREEASRKVSDMDAFLASLPQSMTEAIFGRLALGGYLARSGAGFARRTGAGAAGGAAAEVPTEVIQQMIERYQAGLPLDSEDAIEEYKEAATAAAMVGGVFGGVAGGANLGQPTPPPPPGSLTPQERTLQESQERNMARAALEDRGSPFTTEETPPRPLGEFGIITPKEVPTAAGALGLEAPQRGAERPVEPPPPPGGVQTPDFPRGPSERPLRGSTALSRPAPQLAPEPEAVSPESRQAVIDAVETEGQFNRKAIKNRLAALTDGDVKDADVNGVLLDMARRGQLVASKPSVQRSITSGKKVDLSKEKLRVPEWLPRQQPLPEGTERSFAIEPLVEPDRAGESWSYEIQGNMASEAFGTRKEAMEAAQEALKSIPRPKKGPKPKATVKKAQQRLALVENAHDGKRKVGSAIREVYSPDPETETPVIAGRARMPWASRGQPFGKSFTKRFPTLEEARQAVQGPQPTERQQALKERAEAEIAFRERADPALEELRKVADDMGLKDVQIELASTIPAEQVGGRPEDVVEGIETQPTREGYLRKIVLNVGIHDPKLSTKQLAERLADALNHESIHALRGLGVITQKEWKMLTSQAARRKRGTGETYLSYAKGVYENESPEIQQEEAVAEMYRAWVADPKNASPSARGVFQKITDFFKRLFGAAGPRADDIMRAIREGEVGRREPVAQTEPQETKASLKRALNHEFPGLIYEKPKGGTSDGGVYRDENGSRYMVKVYRNPDQARSETAANAIYRLAGLEVPRSEMIVSDDGVDAIRTNWIEGGSFDPSNPEHIMDVRRGFALDALMGNWDVVGMGFENLVVRNNRVFRIDNGSSFEFKAQGEPKPYDATASEIVTLRDPMVNEEAAHVFGSMDHTDIGESINALRKLDPVRVRKAIQESGPGDETAKENLFRTLWDRREALLSWQATNAPDTIPEKIGGLGKKDTDIAVQAAAIVHGQYREEMGERNFREQFISPEEFDLWSNGHWRTNLTMEDLGLTHGAISDAERDLIADRFLALSGKPNQMVHDNGHPMVFYHGTRTEVEFDEFRSRYDGGGPAIFVSPDADFANEFAESFAPEDKNRVIPVIVSAQNVWDFENADHVSALMRELKSPDVEIGEWATRFTRELFEEFGSGDFTRAVRRGDWSVIEEIPVRAAIRRLGFDGFRVLEAKDITAQEGAPSKNLAVFAPQQLKSVFNRFSPFEAHSSKLSIKRSIKSRNGEEILENGLEASMVDAIQGSHSPRSLYQRANDSGADWWSKVFGRVKRADGSSEKYMDAILRNVVSEFARAFDMDRARLKARGLPENIEDLGDFSFGRSLELSQQVAGRIDGAIRFGALGWNEEKQIVEIVPGTKSLEQIFSPIGNRFKKEFYTYAIARRELELRDQGRPGLLNTQTVNINGEDVEIKMTTDRLRENVERASPLFRKVYDDYHEWNGHMVKFAVDTGQVSEAEAETYREASYIPFYRIMENEIYDFRSMTAGGELLGPKMRQFMNNPRGAFDQHLQGSDRAFGDFYEVILKNTQSIISTGLRNKALQMGAKAIDELNEAGITEFGRRVKSRKDGTRVMTFRENGQDAHYDIADPALWVSLTAMKPVQRDGFTKLMRELANVLRVSVTHVPGFMLANLWRGKVSAYVINDAPLSPFTTVSGAMDAAKETATSDSVNMKVASGIGGYNYGMGEANFAKELSRKYRLHERSDDLLGRAMDRVYAVKSFLDRAGEVSEHAERIALYRKLKKDGYSDQQAAYEAMNLINFGRKGAGQGWLGSTYLFLTPMVPFLNARIQGLYRLVENQKGQKRAGTQNVGLPVGVLSRGLVITAASTAAYILNSDDERWEDEPVERKVGHDIFYPPGMEDVTFYLPRAFEVGSIFGAMPVMALDAVRNDRGADFARGVGTMLLSTFAFNPIPQGLLPALELVMNKNLYTMAPIESFRYTNMRPEDRYSVRTSELAKAIGQQTGESAFLEAFGLNLSPIQVDHAITGYLGGMASWILAVMDSVSGMAGLTPTRPSGVFGDPHSVKSMAANMTELNRFLKLEGETPSRTTREFYRMKRIADEWGGSLRAAIVKRDMERVKEILEEQKAPLAVRRAFGRLGRRIGELNTLELTIRFDRDMSPDEKRRKLDEITKAKRAAQAAAVRIGEKAGL